jgi:UDP-glucose 4-epimerase
VKSRLARLLQSVRRPRVLPKWQRSHGTPNNLVPNICQVVVGRHEYPRVFGNDYPTPDGSGVRAYIYSVDVVEGHMATLGAPTIFEFASLDARTLGTEFRHSVLDVVQAFEKVSGQALLCRIMPQRPGDIAQSYADPTSTKTQLRWSVDRNLSMTMRDAWRWQNQNTQGHVSAR